MPAQRLMRRAIELSKRGFPAPNPHVGCVVAQGGQIVGEGFHEAAGGPHAEVVALGEAGARARGGELYVTLEPCHHSGRTPPCTEAILRAGISKVYFACPDPNPKAWGGAEHLREAGVQVASGVCEAEAEEVNAIFLGAMRLGRPFVSIKAAMTLDGRIALPSGESQWITGPKAREEAHRLRAESGVVLVGLGTVLADDPLLTARIPGVVNPPLKVVLDPEERLSGRERLFEGGGALHVVPRATREGQLEVALRDGKFDLPALLALLWERGETGLLVEGGAWTHARFLEAGLVDRLELFLSPRALGQGPAWLESQAVRSLAEAYRFAFRETRLVGDDLWVRAVPQRG